jgi:hypothetical protein
MPRSSSIWADVEDGMGVLADFVQGMDPFSE